MIVTYVTDNPGPLELGLRIPTFGGTDVDLSPLALRVKEEEEMEQRSGRTSMAMKFFAVWIIFPLCLAAVCISQRAAAVTMGYAGANSNPPPTCDEKTGVCTLTVTIGGYSAPSGNPSDYGMCGILGVYGNLARAKEARITIAGNQYQATLVWTGGGITPPIELEWTCVHLTEFSGLPAAAKFEVNQPSPVTSSSGSASSRQIAGEPDACIWTGIARLPSSGDDATTFDVSTQAESGGNKTVASAQTLAGSLSTFAFCYTFAGKSSAWKYKRTGPFTASPITSMPGVDLPGTAQSQFWCFMVGVQGDKISATPAFSASLQIDHMVHPSLYQYYVNSQGLYWNCLPFSQ